jgi:hypothetical protein
MALRFFVVFVVAAVVTLISVFGTPLQGVLALIALGMAFVFSEELS